jgi:hypothetical protein
MFRRLSNRLFDWMQQLQRIATLSGGSEGCLSEERWWMTTSSIYRALRNQGGTGEIEGGEEHDHILTSNEGLYH